MISAAMHSLRVTFRLVADLLAFVCVLLRRRRTVAAENLFLRKQLAMYVERRAKPRRPDVATRLALTLLSKGFNWRDALVVVQPRTLIRWHREGFRLFWRWQSKVGE
jgi:hypothetical protein